MKKVLVLMLCISMMVGLTACNNSNDEKDNKDKSEETKVSKEKEEEKGTGTDETEEEKETKEAQTEKVVENSEVELSSTHRKPLTADLVLNIDFPGEYMPIEQGYTQMFNVGRDKSISFVFHLDHKPTSLEDAYGAALEAYIQGFNNYADIDTLTAEKEEVIEINGREMYHFEGKLNCSYSGTKYDLYCTGYSFIMDDIPVMLIGTVLEDEQPQEMIDEVKMYTDAMIQTVREAE